MIEQRLVSHSREEKEFVLSSPDDTIILSANVSNIPESSLNNWDFFRIYVDTNKGIESAIVRIHNNYQYDSLKLSEDKKSVVVKFSL
jgi:hypothetical protein